MNAEGSVITSEGSAITSEGSAITSEGSAITSEGSAIKNENSVKESKTQREIHVWLIEVRSFFRLLSDTETQSSLKKLLIFSAFVNQIFYLRHFKYVLITFIAFRHPPSFLNMIMST